MNKKIRVALVFWVYCAILITFNEFIGLFVSKAFMRVGYIFLMVLFFGTTLDRYNFTTSEWKCYNRDRHDVGAKLDSRMFLFYST